MSFKLKTRIFPMALLMVISAGGTSLAHHSYAAFDTGKSIKLKGTVEEWKWENPHIHLHFVTMNADGGATKYVIETVSPALLERRGINRHTYPPGTSLTIVVHPSYTNPDSAGLFLIYKPDGSFVQVGPGRPPGATGAPLGGPLGGPGGGSHQ